MYVNYDVLIFKYMYIDYMLLIYIFYNLELFYMLKKKYIYCVEKNYNIY